MSSDRPTYAPEETLLLFQSMDVRMKELERQVRDHDKRFDTLQTPWWKRVWFKVDGWPWYNLNGTQRRRPWHRDR